MNTGTAQSLLVQTPSGVTTKTAQDLLVEQDVDALNRLSDFLDYSLLGAELGGYPGGCFWPHRDHDPSHFFTPRRAADEHDSGRTRKGKRC